jgi:hypothetical protein
MGRTSGPAGAACRRLPVTPKANGLDTGIEVSGPSSRGRWPTQLRQFPEDRYTGTGPLSTESPNGFSTEPKARQRLDWEVPDDAPA